ncbi:MAG: UDP-forming cellulose synthase catalytic subunit [Pseudomonadota bacterium]|nr:UDP-forming cellulose synthase catalytic subunit [Pseudomonadota bacterium]
MRVLAETRLGNIGVAGLACLTLVIYATVDLPLSSHLLLSAGVMAMGYWLARRAAGMRLALVYLSTAASLRYMVWRGAYTLGLDRPGDRIFAYLLFAAECYALLVLLAGYFQTAVLRPRRPVPLPDDTATWPSVDVFIPTYDESPDIVRRTLIGAMGMTYPNKTVHLLDDGRRPAMRELAASVGAQYHVRADNSHAKAGNINAALAVTGGELIAIFDCDHVPVRSFLNVTVGFFTKDPKMALVQTPHHFYNPDPFERNLWLEGVVPPEQNVFYHAVQVGNDFWNSVLFCGSCAVLRRAALAEIGGIAKETVTEDAHTSLRLLARGWNSAYLDIPQAAGLATERYAFHIAQRLRWARGMTQIFRLDNPLFMRGLTIPQRLNFLNAIQHFQLGLPRLVFLLAPAVYLLSGLHPLAANPWDVLAYGFPHMLLSLMGGLACARSMRLALWAEVYEAAIAPYSALITTVTMIAPKRGKFNVTEKGTTLDRARFDWRHATPNLVILVLALAAAVAVPFRVTAAPLEAATLIIAGLFNLYNILILLAALMVALERPQQREAHRIRREFRVRMHDPASPGRIVVGRSVDLSESGARIRIDAGEAVPAETWLSFEGVHGWTPPVRFEVRTRFADALPGDLPDDPASAASCDLGGRFLEPSEADRHAIIELMFGEPDSWTIDHTHRAPSAGMSDLVRAPWRAAVATWQRNRAGSA